jgi:hypothetical protein
VTGWAALRWRGAAYFDGLERDGTEIPVQLVVPTYADLSARPGVTVERRWTSAEEVGVVDGLPCAVPARALFDEVHRRGQLWSAVQAIDMAAAARLISVWLFALFLGACNSRNGVPLAREAAALAVDESWSPMEPWHRLVWKILAGLPEPLVNPPVYALDGRLLGHPDLFDPTTGTAGEFNGEIHGEREQRRRDVARREDFVAHGVEVVEVVGGDTGKVAAERMQRAHRRAQASFETRPRRWTLEPPAWVTRTETLDEYFVRTGQVERLSVHPFEVGRAFAA